MSSGLPISWAILRAASSECVSLAVQAPDGETQPERVAGVALGLAGAGPPRDVDRPRQHLGRLRPVVDEHEDLAVAREHARELGRRRIVRDEPDRRLVRRQRPRRVAVVPQRPPEPLLGDPQPDRVAPGQRDDRLPPQRDRPPAVARKPRGLRDHVEEGRAVHPGDLLGVVHRGPLLERPLAVPLRIGECVGSGRGVRRAHGGLERAADIARRGEVPGELRPVAGRRCALTPGRASRAPRRTHGGAAGARRAAGRRRPPPGAARGGRRSRLRPRPRRPPPSRGRARPPPRAGPR